MIPAGITRAASVPRAGKNAGITQESLRHACREQKTQESLETPCAGSGRDKENIILLPVDSGLVFCFENSSKPRPCAAPIRSAPHLIASPRANKKRRTLRQYRWILECSGISLCETLSLSRLDALCAPRGYLGRPASKDGEAPAAQGGADCRQRRAAC